MQSPSPLRCFGNPPQWWWPTSRADLARARGVCGNCTTRDTCLEQAIRNEESGVWGGVLLENGRVRTNVFRHDEDADLREPAAHLLDEDDLLGLIAALGEQGPAPAAEAIPAGAACDAVAA